MGEVGMMRQENSVRYAPFTRNLVRVFSVLTALSVGWLGFADTAHAARPAEAPLAELLPGQEPPPAVCFAEGTSQDYVAQVTASVNNLVQNSLNSIDIDPNNRFRPGMRWASTATNGGGLTQGTPTTLTWSYVPDGTTVQNSCGVPGEVAGDASNFQAFFNTQFGAGNWHALFVDIFAKWSAITGLTFVFEPNDDGVPFATSTNPGVLGVRGDIRIGGHTVDGSPMGGSVLACNYFPDNGDMIIDTADTFYTDDGGSNVGTRNVLSHEMGHGLGINHVCPVDMTKLMEPFVTTLFDGPQFDDTLAGQRMYGDPKEQNDTSVAATDHGALAFGVPHVEANMSIDGATDAGDFFKFTAPAGGMATIGLTLNPQAPYLEGPQNMDGTCTAGTLFDQSTIQNLGLELLGPDGTTVLAVVDGNGATGAATINANPAGQGETIVDVALPNGVGPYFVRVFGDGVDNIQLYSVTTTLSAVIAAIPTLPQWAFILMTLSLLTLATWQLTGQPNLLYSAVNGGGLAVANLSQLAAPMLIGQGLAAAGLASYGVFVSALVPHDLIGGALAGILLGAMVACYQRGRAQ